MIPSFNCESGGAWILGSHWSQLAGQARELGEADVHPPPGGVSAKFCEKDVQQERIVLAGGPDRTKFEILGLLVTRAAMRGYLRRIHFLRLGM